MKTTSCWAISIVVLGMFGAAQAQTPDPWANPIGADHPGFSDASSTVGPGTVQAELGAEFAFSDDTTGALGLLARFGIVDGLEARVEIPSLILPMPDGQDTVLDSVELGVKWQFMSGDSISLAVLPALMIPAGFEGASVGGVSGALSLIADISLADDFTLTTSVTPRLVRVDNPVDADELDTTFDLSFAMGVGWALTRAIGLYIEGWGVVAEAGDSVDVTPAADLVFTVLITPNMMIDLYGGAIFGDDTTPYAGLGYSVRF